MAEWNPITGTRSQREFIIFSTLASLTIAGGAYSRFVFERKWGTLLFGLGIWCLLQLAALFRDVVRFKGGKRPFLWHLVVAGGSALYGIYTAVQISDHGLSTASIAASLAVAFAFVVLALMSLFGFNTFQSGIKAITSAIALGLIYLLYGARLADLSNDAREFYFVHVTVAAATCVFTFFLFGRQFKKEEFEFAAARTTLVEH